MIHASDNQGQHDDHLPPGDGQIAWQPFLEQLADIGFKGTIILEIAGSEDDLADPILQGARRARRHLRKIGRRLGLR